MASHRMEVPRSRLNDPQMFVLDACSEWVGGEGFFECGVKIPATQLLKVCAK